MDLSDYLKVKAFTTDEEKNDAIVYNQAIVQGKWVEGYFIKNSDNEFFVVYSQNKNCDRFVKVLVDTISRFTGFYDKNGKKIYANDMVYLSDKNKKKVYLVQDYGYFSLDYEEEHTLLESVDPQKIENIGNKFSFEKANNG